VKDIRTTMEKKTPGTVIVEKYRPKMNKLTPTQRLQLRGHAMRIAFGHESERAPGPRR
jgi:hypothetical protein